MPSSGLLQLEQRHVLLIHLFGLILHCIHGFLKLHIQEHLPHKLECNSALIICHVMHGANGQHGEPGKGRARPVSSD